MVMGLGLFFGDLDDPDNEDAGDDDVNDSVLNVLVRFLMLMERLCTIVHLL